MAHNSKDITFLDEAGCQSVKKLSVTMKSILTGPKTGKWSYAFTKKNVNFVQQEGCVKKDGRRTKMQDKWRKYVAQQFKTLHKKKRQQRTRWLGRAGRNRKKSGPESTPACGDSSENVPSTSEDPSTSSELQESFELPEPDHRKRKKKTKEKAKQRSSPKTTKPKRNQQQKQQEEQEKEANAEGGEEVAPKRPPNAYIIFSQVCRVEFKDLMIPTFDSRLVAMVLGHVWRFLSKAERHCFYEEAEKLSREYQDEKQRLKPVAGDIHPYEKLKRPLNAFMLFCQDRRMELQPKTSALSGQRAAKQMARMWNRMSAKDKQVYVDRAALASSLYHERLKECREQVSILPITLGTTEEEDTTEKKDEEKDKKGDKNATKKTASNPALKKFGKNNNKWLTDSDTDGSQTNSDTHLRVQDLAPNSTRHRSTLPPCSPLVNAPQHSSSLEMTRSRLGKESEPGLVGPRVSFTDSGEQLQGRPLSGSDIGLSPSDASNSSDVSLASNGYTRRRGGSRGRKKKKRKVRRVGDASRGGQASRQVRWKDEFYPWDTYSPVASVLCDEDICTRLCRPPTPPLSQTSLYRPAPRLSQTSLCRPAPRLTQTSLCRPSPPLSITSLCRPAPRLSQTSLCRPALRLSQTSLCRPALRLSQTSLCRPALRLSQTSLCRPAPRLSQTSLCRPALRLSQTSLCRSTPGCGGMLPSVSACRGPQCGVSGYQGCTSSALPRPCTPPRIPRCQGVQGLTSMMSMSRCQGLGVERSGCQGIGVERSGSGCQGLGVERSGSGCQGARPCSGSVFQDVLTRAAGAVPWLQCAAAGYGTARPCRPASPCNTCSSRRSSSCVSVGSRKARMDAAFLKPELDLAHCSSSASSDCNTCPYILPDVYLSSSHESAASNCCSDDHISSYDGSGRQRCRQRQREADLSYSAIPSLLRSDTVVPHLAALADSGTDLKVDPFTHRADESAHHQQAGLTDAEFHTKLARFLGLCKNNDSSRQSRSTRAEKDADVKTRDRTFRCLNTRAQSPSDLSVEQGSHMGRSLPSSVDCLANGKETPGLTTDEGQPTKMYSSSTSRDRVVKHTGDVGRWTERDTSVCEEVGLSRKSHGDKERLSDLVDSYVSTSKLAQRTTHGDKERLSDLVDSYVSTSELAQRTTHGDKERLSDLVDKYVSTFKLAQRTLPSGALGHLWTPRAFSLDDEGSCSLSPILGLIPDSVSDILDVCQFSDIQLDSFNFSDVRHASLGWPDEFLGLLFRGQGLTAISHAESSMSDDASTGCGGSKRAHSKAAVTKKNLKRRWSCDSLEVANSYSDFSASSEFACSLPKYAFDVDKTSRKLLQVKEPEYGDEVTNSQLCSQANPQLNLQIPFDLELQFCQKKGWII